MYLYWKLLDTLPNQIIFVRERAAERCIFDNATTKNI